MIADTPSLDRLSKSVQSLWADSIAFKKSKTERVVGWSIILKFLGGNWKKWMVDAALQILKDKDLDQEAAQSIPTMEQAKVFRTAIKAHRVPKPTQKKIAKKIVQEGVGRGTIPTHTLSKWPLIPSTQSPLSGWT